GAVEAAQDVHERRLARARRAHDGDELVAPDDEVDAAQRVDLLDADPVDLAERADLDAGVGDGRRAPRTLRARVVRTLPARRARAGCVGDRGHREARSEVAVV